MKLRVEIGGEDDEIVIRASCYDGKIRRLEEAIHAMLGEDGEMVLSIGDTSYFVPKRDILFFETVDGKVKAHTAGNMYTVPYKLFELEQLMPASFVRVSKSCILNATAIYSLSHNLTGASKVSFHGSDKIVYVSRAYYKVLKEKIYAMRIGQI